MDVVTHGLFVDTKRCAIAAGSEEATLEHLLAGFELAARSSNAFRRLLESHGFTAMAAAVCALADRGAEVTLEDAAARRLPLDATLRDLVAIAYDIEPDLAPDMFVHVIALSGEPCVEACESKRVSDSATEDGSSEEGDASESHVLPRAIAASRALEERLRGRVFGQDRAVRMLAQAFVHAELRRGAAGPRGVFTFLGPPGVGKTLLAESLAEALETDDEAWPYKRFDMSTFASEQNYEQLFGVSRFYRGSESPGTLTGFVHEHGRAVLLFDEIEKAHPAVIQSLLAILDKGRIEDKFLSREVSFADCWIVFTTNLGHELFGGPGAGGGVLSHGRLSSAAVFDLLTHARTRSGRQEGPALAPEFVSRLAKGGAVLFDRLPPRDLMRIVDGVLADALDGADAPEVRANDDAKLAFLLSLAPNIDARQAAARSAAWAIALLEQAVNEHPRAAWRRGTTLQVRCSEDSRRVLTEGENAPRVRVLLVDDDAYLAGALERALANVLVTRVADEASLVNTLGRDGADLVLVDLSLGEPKTSRSIERGAGLATLVHEKAPGVALVLFSENPELRANFEPVAAHAVAAGGARAFLPCRRTSDDDIAVEDFVGAVARLVSDVRSELVFRRYERARKQLVFDTAIVANEDGSLVAELRHARERLVVRADDASAAIRFAGVPRDRFADLVGLERAKSRLGEIVEWLREPQRLAAYGVAPPRGLLLAGPPGTGKTSIARALAGEAGLPFLALSAGELRSPMNGGSEQLIRDLYARARRYAPTLVFIDEIDAIGRSREGRGGDASALNELLTALDGFDATAPLVFTLAATNLPEALDPALVRPGRLDETVVVDVPSTAARRAFFELRLAKIPCEPGIPLEGLVRGTSGCSPAELDRIVREAAYLAAKRRREAISAAELEDARRVVRYGVAKARDTMTDRGDLELVACHEAGHALVHLLGKPGARLEHVSIRPVDGALGFVMRATDETRTSHTRADVLHDIAVSLAGREAELLKTGSMDLVSAGASSDLRRATQAAVRAITTWGFDDEIGPIALAALPEGMRDAAAEATTIRVRAWVLEGRERARKLLEQHRDAWERLTAALLEHEEIDGDRAAAIVHDR